MSTFITEFKFQRIIGPSLTLNEHTPIKVFHLRIKPTTYTWEAHYQETTKGVCSLKSTIHILHKTQISIKDKTVVINFKTLNSNISANIIIVSLQLKCV